MGLLPRTLGSSGSGGDTPTPVPTTAHALWDTHVTLTAVDVSSKYFDLPDDAPDIANGYGSKVIVAIETTVQHVGLSYIATQNEAGKLRRISWNGLDLENDPPLQAGYRVWVVYPITISIEGSAGTFNHDELRNRDFVNQHPIEAITGLKDWLQRLTDNQSTQSHNMGWFETPDALREAYPTANKGDFATVGSTDTIWVWSLSLSDWVNSDSAGNVTSIITPVGGRETGDVNITLEKLGLDGDAAGFNDAVTKRHEHANKALLDSLTDEGDGTKFLNDKGEYSDTPGGGDMYKEIYDPDGDGSVKLADTIMGYTREVILKILKSGGYLITDGDGTKFLNDAGKYVPQTAFWDRWRHNAEMPLAEIAPNGKRYYGYYFLSSVSTGQMSQSFRLPLSSVDGTSIRLCDAIFKNGGTAELFPMGTQYHPSFPGDPNNATTFYTYLVNNASYPMTLFFQVNGFYQRVGTTGTLEVLVKYTKSSDTPIA